MAKYATLDDDTKARWELQRRLCLERQPRIKDDIIDILRKNPRIYWDSIAEYINNWCSAATIRCWVTSRGGYSLYTEQIIPLLSEE
eukprot:14953230-Ditylum_brightwellii.AAC.1